MVLMGIVTALWSMLEKVLVLGVGVSVDFRDTYKKAWKAWKKSMKNVKIWREKRVKRKWVCLSVKKRENYKKF